MSSSKALGSRFLSIFGGLFFVLGATALIITPLEFWPQVTLSAGLFSIGWLLGRFRGRRVDLALMLLSVLVSARYMFWRLTMTVESAWSVDLAVGLLLLGAEVYAFFMLLLGYFQAARPLERKPVALPEDPAAWPTVDIFIPTYNEPLKVVRATALAAQAMDWPADKLKVWILDDGGRSTGWKNDEQVRRARARNEEFSKFAKSAGIGYITRPDNSHAKAGNLNHALTKTKGEFVAIFDCDHVPTRSFLQMTMGWMVKDPSLALVQTPHHFYSPDPLERNLQVFGRLPNEGQLFYGLVQPGNDLWDATFFCGSCAVIRREPLEAVGGIAVETVTEDAHTALKMQRKGWSTAYIGIPQAAGLATESLSAHVGQRIRWARGMAQIFRIDNPLLGRGLRLGQRFCYASAMLYFFYGAPRLIFLLAPSAYLVFGLHIFDATPALILAYALPHLVHATGTNSRIQGKVRASLWSEVYEACLAIYILLPTTIALFAPKMGSFNVTAKGGIVDQKYFDLRIAWPYLVLAGANLLGMGLGAYELGVGGPEFDVAAINIAWSSYNLLILGGATAVAWESQQLRDMPRVPTKTRTMVYAAGRTYPATATDLSLKGAALALRKAPVVEVGSELRVSVFFGDEEQSLPARVVAVRGDRLGVNFDDLTTEEETALVRAIFSPADRWKDWVNPNRRDHPFASLFSIGRYGLASSWAFVSAAARRATS